MFQVRTAAIRPVAAALAALLLLAAIPVTALAAVDNDERADAIAITSLPFTAGQDTSEATRAGDDPNCIGIDEDNTVWYRYDPVEPVDLRVDTFGSDYDTVLSVWIEDGGELIALACNDDAEGLQSEVYLSAFPGSTYWIMVGAFQVAGGGSLVLSVEEGVEPPQEWIDISVDFTSATIYRDGHVLLSGTVTCSREAWGTFFGSIRQRVGRTYVNGFVEGHYGCSPSPQPIHAFSYTEDGVFAGGAIQITGHAFAEANNAFGSAFVSDSVRARPGR